MKKLLAAAVVLAALASVAHATNPTVHVSANGPLLQATSDVDTLHITLTGNDNLEPIGILWFFVATPPQLKLYQPYPEDRRYVPDVFWTVNPTDQTMDSVGVDGYGRSLFLITLNAYQPADSCMNYRTPNVSGKVGHVLVRLRQAPDANADYSVSLMQTFSTYPGTIFPPAVPWTQLCNLVNGTYQPGVDAPPANTVTISASPQGGGGCGWCCTHTCEGGITAARRTTWGRLKGIYR